MRKTVGIYIIHINISILQTFKTDVIDESDDRMVYESMSTIDYAKKLIDENIR